MELLSPAQLEDYLAERGWIPSGAGVELEALTGGVSSEIFLVRSPAGEFVVKQARPRLRVEAEWLCDPQRNLYEQAYLEFVGSLLPGAVPKLLHCDPERGLFLMEYLDGGWSDWKARLWCGELSEATAGEAGRLLGTIHRGTWGSEEIARRFRNTDLFRQLRVDPYLRTTAERHACVREAILAEADRLEQTHLALVHGDYSPKNLMTSGDSIRILDAEVAWFGDPAFDVAFLLNHLVLKGIRFPDRAEGFRHLRQVFRIAYVKALGRGWDDALDQRVTRLLLMLMLARISGKSPVEYIPRESEAAAFIIRFTTRRIGREPLGSLDAFEQALDLS